MTHVVIGSGIVGLYTTYNLIEAGKRDITVIAEFLPGDESVNFTSPYAGGNFSCITGNDELTLSLDKQSYLTFPSIIAKLGGPECGLDYCYSTEYWDEIPPLAKIDLLKSYLIDYQELAPTNGAAFGIRYKSFSFNCPKFLVNLKTYLESQGVVFIRKKLTHISQGFTSDTKVVFNCTGLGSFHLNGVNDTKMYPTRGQVLAIKAPHITENTLRWGKDYATYIIKRPFSDDQAILGGFMQKDWWTGDTFHDQNQDILKRTTALVPEILTKNPHGSRIEDLEILRSAAGLRPSRHGGVRIEKEVIDGKVLIHNYGAGGYGYQAGYAMGHHAVGLLLKPNL